VSKRSRKGTTVEEKIKKARTGKNFQPDIEVEEENSADVVSDESVSLLTSLNYRARLKLNLCIF